ncbi:MAG TPA: hypothetical protein VKA89_12895 [Solirubrobacterales bacterium]|nr:hypothetical protein [Solirubrobacterales bacterium]
MATNGKRRPPRPRIELAGGDASPEEAAAIAAALQRHLADTAPAPRQPDEPSPWLRAALLEGVSARRAPIPPEPGSGLPI